MALTPRKTGFLLATPFLFLFCLCATNPVSTTPPGVNAEFKFAASVLYNYFIFRDSLPANPYEFSTPQALYQSVREPYTSYVPKDSAGPLLRFLDVQTMGVVPALVTARAAPPLPQSVFFDTISAATAYIFISVFLNHTATPGGTVQEFENALAATGWAAQTILDLRGNPGGDLEQCLRVCSEFIAEKAPIINSHERALSADGFSAVTVDTILRSSSPHHALTRKFVCLTDRGTASAAEILVACLNSNRADILTVGQTTFGKARGQVLSLTPDSGLVRVTFALFKPVSGSPYDLIGIPPEVAVALDGDALAAALELIAQGTGKRAAAVPSFLNRIDTQRSAFRFVSPGPLAMRMR